jgi:hypothetical protein
MSRIAAVSAALLALLPGKGHEILLEPAVLRAVTPLLH